MKPIAIIINGQLSGKPIKNTVGWKKRKAARAIILDNQNKIPLIWSNKHQFHKIPGGCAEEKEEIRKALKREIMEEIGAKIKRIKYLGVIKEYWTKGKYYQKIDAPPRTKASKFKEL